MPTRIDLTLYEGNDEEVAVTVTTDDGAPYDLSSVTLEMVIKPSAGTPDTAEGVYRLSTVTGEIVVDNAAAGAATVTIDRSILSEPGTRAWRLDAVAPGTRRTIMYGPLHIIDL